jgi:hypothetical protein
MMSNENKAVAVQARGDSYAQMWKFAVALSKAPIVPKHYRDEPGNVFVAADYARHMDLPILAVMQGTFVVQGTLGWGSAFLIARTNQAGPFDGPMKFDEEGSLKAGNYRVRCTGKIGGELYTGTWVDLVMAKAEGWTKNSKYQSLPELMLRYRAATFFVRQTCPEVMLGLRTVDELEDMAASGQLARDVDAEPSAAAALNAELEPAEEPREVESDDPDEDADADEQAARDAWAKGGAA